MQNTHERFNPADDKRLVLIADDEYINREMLRENLQDHYELLFAENGQEALDQMRAHKNTLSLVLLDLMMPVMSGIEMLKQVHQDPEISQIPIIVATANSDAEVESLNLGATDFIRKPYPNSEVIYARARRIIELFEDQQIINSTERDSLTGLFNREYFYRYSEQFDRRHPDVEMDAIVVDVNHFHMINERFGAAYGDNVLKRVGASLRAIFDDIGGLVCRREADTFMVYCPHGKDYDETLESAAAGLSTEGDDDARIWLRMGVYANVDKSFDIERRFDRAKMAADKVQGSFAKSIGIYDSSMHEQELYSEQLIEDFSTAIKEHQFKVHYQPKFDIRPAIPVLASAEALVRWEHPTLGMISPGIFIPLFEENGLIQQLDTYVWRETSAKIREWKDRFDFSVPVSVNVSRIDMYDPHLVDTFQEILDETGLSPQELYLEITESAYTQDSKQIIETVGNLRSLGFKVEMDDFGTGYSSLNMISTLPIDALKLDMQFIRNAFSERADVRMIEVIIDIADYLGVPVIAEGVETEEQMIALKGMGCDYVQGYYFSRPVPSEEYEKFVIERKDLTEDKLVAETIAIDPDGVQDDFALGEIKHALSSGFDDIYYIDTDSNHYVEFNAQGKRDDLQIEETGADFFAEAAARIAASSFPEDRARVELSLQKDALIAQLTGSEPFIMTYRNLIEGEPIFYNLKAVRAHTHDDHHIVVGISNIDEQVKQTGTDGYVNELNFSSLAQALSSDMESIYYIDVASGTFLEYTTGGIYGKLKLEVSGTDFFGECQRNIEEVVYPDDREKVSAALAKDALLGALKERYVFSMAYRLVFDGHPLYYRLKAVWADGVGGNHVIIGVSNIDAQITEEEKLEAQRQSSVTYASIVKALATDYFSIYYVNTVNDHFIEYSSHAQYQELNIEKSGDDFFNLSRENIRRVAHPDDIEMILSTFTKDNILASLEHDRPFTLTYRLMFSGEPTYVHMKVTQMEDKANKHIVIGVSNIDEQIKREHEYAQALRMANQDALTGVKSKHAYDKEELVINEAIAAATQQPFALAVCDVNGLKQINDTLGHNAGDAHIKKACAIVCTVFEHSPVYRIGGDEFVAILRGRDFENRERLMEELDGSNRKNARDNGVLVAGGLTTFQPGIDATLSAVFERADAAMYENKKNLKQLETA